MYVAKWLIYVLLFYWQFKYKNYLITLEVLLCCVLASVVAKDHLVKIVFIVPLSFLGGYFSFSRFLRSFFSPWCYRISWWFALVWIFFIMKMKWNISLFHYCIGSTISYPGFLLSIFGFWLILFNLMAFVLSGIE